MKDDQKRRYRFDEVEVDVRNLRVTIESEVRPLEPKSFRLLLFLIENRSRVVPKEEIMAAVWPDAVVSDNSLPRAIGQIRKALNDNPKAPRYIETVPTIGYRFVGDCKAEPDAIHESEPGMLATDASTRLKLLFTIGGCLALAVAFAVWWMASVHDSSVPYPLRVTRVSKVTSYPGDEREPSISPDGSYVAFSWSGAAGDNYDIYVVQTGGQQPLRLTTDPAPDSFPAWSPDGRQIAFVRRSGLSAEIIVVSPLGGPERTLHQIRLGAELDQSQHPVLSWSPDGKSIVYSGQTGAGEKYRLFLLSVETGAVRSMSSPDTDLAGDSSPAVSADGKFLAFVRYLAPLNGRLLIQPMAAGMVPSGKITSVTKSGLALRSPIWLDHGNQLLFADAAQIFQWEWKKGMTPIYSANGTIGGISLGPERRDHSRQVVFASENQDPDIWAIPLNKAGLKATGPPQVLQRSTEYDHHPDFSPDGRHMAFASSRSGTAEIWVCDADGGNPRQLTHLGAHVASYPSWSPDGTSIAFHARVPDISEVYVVDLDHGAPRQITHENPGLALATWSHDGQFLYASTLVGANAVSYRIPLRGGSPERLWQGGLIKESADGKYVLYWKPNAPGIFRRSLQGDVAKNPEELLVRDFWVLNQLGGYAPVSGGIYYVSADAYGKPGPFRYFDYASRKSSDVAPAAPGLSRGLSISPDRRRMAFAASAEIGGDLLLLELR